MSFLLNGDQLPFQPPRPSLATHSKAGGLNLGRVGRLYFRSRPSGFTLCCGRLFGAKATASVSANEAYGTEL
jgi:hypothetical protein